MLNNLEPFSHPPKKQQFAAIFRLVSRISFWVQLVLGGISGIAVLLASFSRNITTQTSNAGIGFGIFLAIVGILLLCFRGHWSANPWCDKVVTVSFRVTSDGLPLL